MALDLDVNKASPVELEQASIEFSTTWIWIMQSSGE